MTVRKKKSVLVDKKTTFWETAGNVLTFLGGTGKTKTTEFRGMNDLFRVPEMKAPGNPSGIGVATFNSTSMSQGISITGYDSNFSTMVNSPTGCKDYFNDWVWGIVRNKVFDERFENGAYFFIFHCNPTDESFNKTAKNGLDLVHQFLKDIRYENPEHLELVAIDTKARCVAFHVTKRLLCMPAVMSGIFMLMRNSYMYKEGTSSIDYLTRFKDSDRANSESSAYRYVIQFIEMFANKESIMEIFPEDYTVGWASDIANHHGVHGGFGIGTFSSGNLIEVCRKLGKARQAAIEAPKVGV